MKSYTKEIATQIIELLTTNTAPWVKPWSASELCMMSPYNPTTNKNYTGINFINLFAKTMSTGDARWLTYKQASTLGGQVKKGSKATTIQYWKFEETKTIKGKKITVELERPRVFYAKVFNGSQIENLPAIDEVEEKPSTFKDNSTLEEILIKSNATINHGGDRAFYMPSHDFINLPKKESFTKESEYYSTALHELSHWTGHESRLNRDMSGGKKSLAYALEELNAEIGSFMFCASYGIEFNPTAHISYIKSWVQALEDTPKAIFKASSNANKIKNFILNICENNIKSVA
jgi:antirestriction protein ArdC